MDHGKTALILTILVTGFSLGLNATAGATASDSNKPEADKNAVPASSAPDHSGRLSIINENDYYASNNDRHYTQGARISYLSGSVRPDGFWDKPFALLNATTPLFDNATAKRKYALRFGQNMYTPQNTEASSLQTNDRPYAAWLYGGVGLLQESTHPDHHTLENFELVGGVVGRWALGGVTQNDFHQFIDVEPSLGWENQLKNEPGLIATYERKWRFQQPLYRNLAVDIIPELGFSGGNILTYGQASLMVRLGQNIAVDYGPSRIRPGLSGTDWFDADQLNGDFGWYLFAGTQVRAMARNIFLDGNTFDSSPHIGKKPLVADFMLGASMFWSDAIRLDFSVVQRTDEFYGQRGNADRFGGINLTFKFF